MPDDDKHIGNDGSQCSLLLAPAAIVWGEVLNICRIIVGIERIGHKDYESDDIAEEQYTKSYTYRQN